jgi:cysteine-rich repeat protein
MRASDEACDDGNNMAGDGCSTACFVESGFSCSDQACEPSVCWAVICGDGILYKKQ